ncbi:hypothetical protein [uncultured Tessaracoccus sp.]|uniref:hypothetical protein n=1 Tax=uncultured Tessaracoccus sp. TaxID=905023 RepID=UPI0025D975B7|nr:hypothetical protein [uncultured Tessaracoccus sp.]
MTLCPRCYCQIAGPGQCGTCGFDVPPEWLEHVQLSLAVTGARTAGKSVLIGVMMDQFEYFLSTQDSFLTPVGTTKQRFHDKYRVPLLQQRNLLGATPPADQEGIEPLLWDFTHEGVHYCMSIIDAAGEDFERLDPGDERFRYLGFSDFIVTLVDPLKVPGVSAVLDGVVTVPHQSGDDVKVLQQVLRARAAQRAGGGPEQVLAVVLSKFDVLQRLRGLRAAPWQSIFNRPGSAMQRDPSMVVGHDNELDGALLHEELRGLLELLDARMVISAANQAGLPFRLFAISALGAEPDAQSVGSGGIIPFRVLDVLQAALAKKRRDLHGTR